MFDDVWGDVMTKKAKPKTMKDVARNVQPKVRPTASYITPEFTKLHAMVMTRIGAGSNLTPEFIAVAAKHKAPTRTPYDLLMAVCGLAMFFTVTHEFLRWPL